MKAWIGKGDGDEEERKKIEDVLLPFDWTRLGVVVGKLQRNKLFLQRGEGKGNEWIDRSGMNNKKRRSEQRKKERVCHWRSFL